MLILWQKYMYLIISSVNHIDFWLYYLYYIENVFVEKKSNWIEFFWNLQIIQVGRKLIENLITDVVKSVHVRSLVSLLWL